MASTYSALKIELIATGEQSGTWGATTNVNLGDAALGEAITGSADVAFSSADVTITLTDTNTTQTARNLRLNLTGTSGGARNLILGSGCQIEKLYLVNNGLADAVTVKNTTGTGIAVAAGKTMFVYNNGTNVVDAITHLTSLTTGVLSASGATTFTAGTASTSTTTGTAVITGGLGVSGRVNAANFDGIVGANTAAAGSFTTVTASGNISGDNAILTGDVRLPLTGKLSFNGSASSTYMVGPSSGIIDWYLASSQVMRLNSTGLGIGTSSPSMSLDVSSGATASTANFTSTTTTAYSPTTSASVTNARLTLFGGNATSAYTAIRFTQSGSFENFFGAVQSSAGTGQFVWGGYNGAAYGEWMRLDSSTNLGLGVTPSAADNTLKYVTVGNVGNSFAGFNGSVSSYVLAGTYYNGGWKYAVSSSAVSRYDIGAGSHAWLTAPSGTAGNAVTFTQAMTLDASGNLGLGTTSPTFGGSRGIHIANSSGDSRLHLTDNTTGTTANDGTEIVVNSGNLYIDQKEAQPIIVLVGGSERMRIDSGGRIGFGTGGTVADRLINAGFTSVTTTGGTQFGFVFNPTYPNTATANIYHTYFYPNLTAGTTLTNLYNLYLEANNITGSTVANSYGVYQAGSNDKNYFAGNVGIGTSSPAGKFDITGESNSTVNSYFRAYGGTSARANMILDMYTTTAGAAGNLTFQRAHDNTLGGITDVSSGDVLGNINFYGTSRGNGSYNSGGNIQVKVNGAASTYVPADMYIYTNSGSTDRSGNPQLAILSNGTIRFLSTISVGNTAPSTSGSGITFPATQDASSDANTLDDYEEGTWTPNQGSGLTVVGSFSSTAFYTKIGRIVTVTGKLQGSTSISLAANGQICSNLPFTAINTAASTSGGGIAYDSAPTTGIVIFTNSNATVLVGAAVALPASGTIYFSATYTAAS